MEIGDIVVITPEYGPTYAAELLEDFGNGIIRVKDMSTLKKPRIVDVGSIAAVPLGRSKYVPGMARMNDHTPQSAPERFTIAEIQDEIRYLLRLNKKHGTHILRVQAYQALDAFLTANPGHVPSV
jgi:hypothetical protein